MDTQRISEEGNEFIHHSIPEQEQQNKLNKKEKSVNAIP